MSDSEADSTSISKSVTIGVAGGTGSGKTTVSRAILDQVGQHHIAYISHDSYYKDLAHIPRADREIINFDHPDSLDTSLMIQHIRQLQQGLAVDIPIYDFSIHTRSAQVQRVEPQPVILIEGILIFSEKDLRELCDVRIFVDTDADIRFIRRLKRDVSERGRSVDSVIHQYLNSVRPMHMEFVEPSKRYADVIIPEGGFNRVAIDMMVDRIRSMINLRRQV